MTLHDLLSSAAQYPLEPEQIAKLNNIIKGLHTTLGWRYTACGPKGASAELIIDQRHLQPAGLVHGGLYAALAEDLGSLAGLVAAPSHSIVGVSNSTQFFAAMRTGMLVAHAIPIHLGRSSQVFEIDFYNGERLVARSTLRTMVLSLD